MPESGERRRRKRRRRRKGRKSVKPAKHWNSEEAEETEEIGKNRQAQCKQTQGGNLELLPAPGFQPMEHGTGNMKLGT
jgi:hypothetical protein